MEFDMALIRVDNRLVHGQILEAWVPYTNASCIIVVNDEVANNYFQEEIIRMALPKDIELITCTVEDFVRIYRPCSNQGKKAIVLFSSIHDAYRAFHLGFRFRKLNLGNILNSISEETILCCSTCVYLNYSDLRKIATLARAEGVQIEIRRIPKDMPIDIRELVSECTCL